MQSDRCTPSGPCRLGVCVGDGWAGVGGSGLGPSDDYLEWGSATGGGVSTSAGNSLTPAIAAGPSGALVVAWQDGTQNREIYVKRFDGTRWRELDGSATGGGISDTADSSDDASVAVDALGNPIVAWRERGPGNNKIFVLRFDGTTWQELGTNSASGAGMSDSSGNASAASVAMGNMGQPIVAWVDDRSGAAQIYVREFDGSSWQEVGVGSASGSGISGTAGSSSAPTVAIGVDGNPIVAWVDDTSGNREVYVRRFDGAAWQELGVGAASGSGISNNSSSSTSPTLTVDGTGNAVVAWADSPTAIFVRRFNGTTWQEMGAGSATGTGISGSDSASSPSLSVDGSGNPVLAWKIVGFSNAEIYVRRFEGGMWRELGANSASAGGVSDTTGESSSPSMAMDSAGNPVVAWRDGASGNLEIYVRRFDGAIWQETNTGNGAGHGLSGHPAESFQPSLVFDALLRPMLAWADLSSGSSEIYVRRFEDPAWVDVGVGSSGGGGISNTPDGDSIAPALVIDGAGRSVIAWSHRLSFFNWEVYVRRFDGSAWVEVGMDSATGVGVSDTSSESLFPSLAVDAQGNPAVAWQDRTAGPSEVYVRHFDGVSWQSPGGVSAFAVGGSAKNTSLCFDAAQRIIVAWDDLDTNLDRQIYVRRFDGTSWQELGVGSASGGGISDTVDDSILPSLIVDATGDPVIAWSDDTSGNEEIYVRRFDGTSWQEVGSGSATGGGVSNTVGDSSHPSLVLDDVGRLVLAWQDGSSGNHEIYVRRFDGSNWQPVDTGAAMGGGISNSAGESAQPSAAAADGLLCVAYTEAGEFEEQVSMRCTH